MEEEILKTYDIVSKKYAYNSNSLHKLGLDCRKIESASSKQILEALGLSGYEVIYTSGNSESLTMLENNEKKNYLILDLNKKYDNLNKYDFIVIEDEIPFFGVLIKKENIELDNLIHGGKSTTKYRSGTSATPLIASFAKLVKIKYKR